MAQLDLLLFTIPTSFCILQARTRYTETS